MLLQLPALCFKEDLCYCNFRLCVSGKIYVTATSGFVFQGRFMLLQLPALCFKEDLCYCNFRLCVSGKIYDTATSGFVFQERLMLLQLPALCFRSGSPMLRIANCMACRSEIAKF